MPSWAPTTTTSSRSSTPRRPPPNIYSMKPDFLISNALQDRAPLRQILEENVTRDAVVEVAQDSRLENRELYVGTINLDTSQFCEWNLSTIARKAEAEIDDSPAETCWVDLFRDAMFASAGAPVIAPPVEIDVNACKPGNPPPQKMLFADGGVRRRVFVSEVIERIPNGKPTVYVIMNGQMNTRPTCVSNQLLPITLRTFEIMDHEALFGSLYAVDAPAYGLEPETLPDTGHAVRVASRLRVRSGSHESHVQCAARPRCSRHLPGRRRSPRMQSRTGLPASQSRSRSAPSFTRRRRCWRRSVRCSQTPATCEDDRREEADAVIVACVRAPAGLDLAALGRRDRRAPPSASTSSGASSTRWPPRRRSRRCWRERRPIKSWTSRSRCARRAARATCWCWIRDI